ncbi:MAG TPA: RnfABCDGE type electron transport complex subunit B [Steroidobacteraceae bacterium]|nr:RnfABCDGE type electron transport complex subunit B [Steroidobacteraceae bacterium]
MTAATLAARIDALLPQTQCTRCGYTGCLPYAEAIARGEARINQCPPGGSSAIRSLASLLGVEPEPLNPKHGVEGPGRVAYVDESRCIGCARCLAPCPVDAIVGAAKHLHTVLAEHCTGCELCLPPCPVDCIEMRPALDHVNDPEANRARYRAHLERLERQALERERDIESQKAQLRMATLGRS